MLYLREPGFTGELLQQLGRCSPEDLAKLFGVPSRATSPAYGSQPADSAPEGRGEIRHVKPAAELPAELPAERVVMMGGDERVVVDPPAPVWDERGNRISPKLPSSFPRRYEPPMPRGSHWSR